MQTIDGRLPLLAPMSEVAGRLAVQAGAYHLQRPEGGRGTLMGGVPGTAPARVVIIGAGVSGMNAAAIAVGMRADVELLDLNIDKLHAADDLYARTAPAPDGEPLERLLHSITGYVDYVIANQAGYRSLVKAASGSNDALRAIYETTFTALADRFFTTDTGTLDLPDTPAVRLVIHAWQAMVEDLVLTWCETPAGLTRDDLIQVITGALPALIDHLP